MESSMYVQLLHESAVLPTKGSEEAAGFDLYARLDNPITIKSHDKYIVPLDIAITIPFG